MSIGPLIGARIGPRIGARVGSSPVAGATRDATSLIYVPQSAAEYEMLGVTAPSHLYLCQETSGTLADSVGGKALAVTGAPLYQVSVAGWSTKAVGPNGTAQTQTFNNATMANLNASSVAFLVYAIFNQSANIRQCASFGGASNNAWEGVSAANTIRLRTGANAGNGALSHVGQVRPIMVVYDRTNSRNVIYSDIEKRAVTYAAAVGSTLTLTLGIAADAAAYVRFLHAAVWTGSAAELNDATAKARLEALGWTVSGY